MMKKKTARPALVFAFLLLTPTWSEIGPHEALAAYSESDLRAVETGDESRVRELREQEIRQIRIALGRRLPQNRQADLYFRLAEIYLEAYRQEFLLEGRVHEKRAARGPMDRTRSRAQLELGLKACREILAFKIPFSRLDQVLYFMGFNANELGKTNDAVKAFSDLVRRFPQSPYYSEAHRELGEIAYNRKQYREALDHLERALRGIPAPLKPRVEHRLAWSYYRTKQFGRAIATMKQAIEHTQSAGEKFLGLRDEALRDMAVFMTEAGRVEEAIQYFDTVAGDSQYYGRALEGLGANYERNAQPQMASQVYEALLKTKPDSEEAFRVLVKLVDLDLRRGNKKGALNRVLHARWENVPYLGSGNVESAQQAANLKAMVRRTATESHQNFRKKSDREQLQVAELAYEVYLKKFLQDDPRGERIEIQMYLAEVKRDLGKSKEASQLYRQVVQSRDARYAKEAGSLWTASLADAIQKTSARSRTDAPSDLELEYVEASDQLLKSLPGSQPAREARLRATQVLAGYPGGRDLAVERIASQLAEDGGTSQSVTAARLWLQLLQDHPELGRLDRVHGELLANAPLMKADQKEGGKLRALIGEQRTRAQINAIAQDEKKQDFDSAAKGYEAFAQTASARDVAEKALGNAVSAYQKSGAKQEADRVLQAWLKRYPKSPAATQALRLRATHDLIIGEMESAARGFAAIGEQLGDAESFETAARIWEGSGDVAQAELEYVHALESDRKGAGRFRVARALAQLQEKGGKFSQASSAYRNCAVAGSPTRAECLARLGDLYSRLKDTATAQKYWKEVAALKDASAWVGYARFQLAVQNERGVESFPPLKFPEAQLKKGIDSRVQYLETLNRSYQSVVSAGGPWSIMALYRIAQWVVDFADGLDRVEPAAGMSPEAVANMRKGLAGISGGLRKRAADSALSAMARAEQAGALSPALPELGDLAARLKARVRAQGMYPALRLAGLGADGGKEGATAAFARIRAQLIKNAQQAQAWVDYGNLLWGEGKPGLGQLAYDRAIALAPNDSSAWNNRGVVLFASAAEEDWSVGAEALEHWNRALKSDDLALAAKWNKAALLNYYRLFGAARPLWEQVIARGSSAQAVDGLGIAQLGVGQRDAARTSRARAQEMGASRKRFARLYHEAAELAFVAGGCTSEVKDLLESIDGNESRGLEKQAWERFRKECGL